MRLPKKWDYETYEFFNALKLFDFSAREIKAVPLYALKEGASMVMR